MNGAVMRLSGVLLGVAALWNVAAPRPASGRMLSSGTTPGGAVFDRLDRSTTRPVPQVQAPAVSPSVDVWVPDRYVQTPQGDPSVLVPGHWERRLSDHEVYTPPLIGTTPNGDVINNPAGVRPPANERQAP